MNTPAIITESTPPFSLRQCGLAIMPYWPLLLGTLILAVPTFIGLARDVWSKDIGAHGPIVLATGLWLLSRNISEMQRLKSVSRWAISLPALVLALALYIFGRAFDFISLETLGLYFVLLTIFYRIFGWAALRANAFAFFYLGFLVPPPGWVIDKVTAPLTRFISYAATEGLGALGYPIMREGVAIFIGSYQLLVEDACSGMNSIIGLTTITLFYIYLLHRASWRYALLLIALILPVAVLVNLMRVVTLVLLTHYFGDAVAQGFLHMTAGMVLFALALLLVFAIDSALLAIAHRFFRRST